MEPTAAGWRAYLHDEPDQALEQLTRATAIWPDNHAAWLGLALANAKLGEWTKAVDAAGTAVRIAPDVAVHQLVYGWLLYEKAIAVARDDAARKQNRRPDNVDVDLSAVNFDKPQSHLLAAVALAPTLWRAHYLLGAIARAGERPKDAAVEFTKSVQLGAPEPAPWIALAELYRGWDYTDAAIAVTTQATTRLPRSADAWFELGTEYDDRHVDDKAIEAYDHALAVAPDYLKARFARGQAYFRKRDHVHARADLTAFIKAAPPRLDFLKRQAASMLMEMAARDASP
jgi:tetratricopeptide (TPR) repeat protein